MPPVDAIATWVHHKGLASGRGKSQISEERSIAWAIALKIKRVGTQGAHMLQNAFDKNKDRIMQLIKSAVDKVAKQ